MKISMFLSFLLVLFLQHICFFFSKQSVYKFYFHHNNIFSIYIKIKKKQYTQNAEESDSILNIWNCHMYWIYNNILWNIHSAKCTFYWIFFLLYVLKVVELNALCTLGKIQWMKSWANFTITEKYTEN